MTGPRVLVLPDAEGVAAAVAARLLTRLADAQLARGGASVVLTGGGVGIAALTAVRDSAARDTVDWGRVDVWWGDERWVPPDSPDRNDVQARSALLDALPFDPARLHRMGAQRPGATPERDAEAYAAELAGTGTPFDVLLLGMGPEGHTASIFPHSPAARDARTVVAVHDCPKPPPTRLSLGFHALSRAREVWFAVAGQEKADAVARALGGADPVELPAAGPAGSEQTLWLLDAAAASRLSAR
ncbi:MAG: 6-phosphogluconolactonase [Frankiales bacterium]|nr:6-phosphogluconolactonase [Frankiales bacterium]